MPILSKEIKLLTLSLLLRTMPKTQQSLIMQHFAPEVVNALNQIEQETGTDIEKLDWTPFYQTWPDIQRILHDCKKEIRAKNTEALAEGQRPKLRAYILVKLGKQKKGPPVVLPEVVKDIVDEYLSKIGAL